LGNPTGYVVPMRKWAVGGGPDWVSEIWKLRRGHLFLIPGDSPMGMRLPLDSLPHLEEADYPHIIPADPFAERGDLPDPDQLARGFERIQLASRPTARAPGGVPVRTALTVEARDGHVSVFMPPVERLEDYVELLGAVEATAAELKMPVHVEGYAPPS